MSAVRGSCLCGGVKFEITGPLMRVLNCHCSLCRKAQGAAFRSRARVKANDFRWLHGEELVKFYESSPGYYRGFCSVCGSPILNKAGPDYKLGSAASPTSPPEFGIALGCLDGDPGVHPESHCFVASKAPWFEITDDLPQHEGYPPPSP
jgi:hypothetical protein